MRIAAIDVFQVDLPYGGGTYRLSGGREYRSFDATIVRVRTDAGLEGWGESTPFGATYIAAHAAGVRAGVEAPCATWRECVALRRRTDVPIFWDELATDEASIARMIADDAAEGIGLKIEERRADARPAPARHVHHGGPRRERAGDNRLRRRLRRDRASGPDRAGAVPALRARESRHWSPSRPPTEPRMDVLGAPVATYGD